MLGSAIAGLDPQILPDPCEEKLDWPTAAIQFGCFPGRQVQGIG